jgi:hypothetical protein
MNNAREYIKIGGFLGFSSVFLLVFLRDRDVVGAVFDASVACLVMAYAFKILHAYIHNLHRSVIRARQKATAAILDDTPQPRLKSLTQSSSMP